MGKSTFFDRNYCSSQFLKASVYWTTNFDKLECLLIARMNERNSFQLCQTNSPIKSGIQAPVVLPF